MADAEHKVLYRAVADFSELVREAAAARAALAALNRDAAKLGNLKPVRLFDRDDAANAARTTTETGRLTETVTKHGKAVSETARQRKAAATAAKEQAEAERSLGAVFSDVARQQEQALTRRRALQRDNNAVFSDANTELESGQKSLAAVFSEVARARDAATAATQAHTAVLLANTLAANQNESALRPDGGGGGIGPGGAASTALLLGQNPTPIPSDVSGLDRARQAAKDAVAEWEESLQRITGLHHDFEKERLRDWTEAMREDAVRERRRAREAQKAAEAEAKAEAAREAKRIGDPDEARAAAEAEQRRRTWWRRQTVERAWESALKMDAEFEKRRQRQLDKLHAEAVKLDEQREREREATRRRSAPDLAREARAGINEATSPQELKALMAEFRRMAKDLAAEAVRETRDREAAAKRAAAEMRAAERLVAQERAAEEKRAAAEQRAQDAETRRLAREAEAEEKRLARERAAEARRLAKEAEAEEKRLAREEETKAKKAAKEAEAEARRVAREAREAESAAKKATREAESEARKVAREAERVQKRTAREAERELRRAERESARESEKAAREEEARAERVRKAWERAYASRGRFGKLLLELAYPDGPDTASGGDDGGRRRRRRTPDEEFGDHANRGLIGLLRHNLAVQALLKLLPLIPPLVGAGTAAFASFGAAGVAALSGIVGFAVAAIGHIAQLKSAIDDFQKTGVLPTGPTGEMVEIVYQLKVAYDEFLKSTQGPVFEVFNKAMEIAVKLLDKFEPVVNAAADGLTHVATAIEEAIDSPEFQEFLEFLERQAPQAIQGFGLALLSIVQGIMALSVALEPFIDFFLDGFQRMAEGFREWAEGLQGSEQLAEFFDWAREQGPELLEMFRAVGAALIELGVALAPLGGLLITLIEAFAKFVDWTIEFIPLAGQLIAVLGLLAIALKLKGLLESVAALRLFVGAVKALYTAQGAALVVGVLSNVMMRFGVAAQTATAAAAVFTTALRGLLILTGIGAVIVAVTALVSAFSGSHEKAAEEVNAHAAALATLRGELERTGGVIDEQAKRKIIEDPANAELFREAELLGINPAEIARALTDESSEEFDRLIAMLKQKKAEIVGELAAEENRNDFAWITDGLFGNEDIDRMNGAIDIIDRVTAALTGTRAGAQEAVANYRRVHEGLQALGDGALDTAAKVRLFNDVLASMQSPPTGPLDNAISAMDAYKSAVSQAADAEYALSEARVRARQNDARAAQDVRRAERDLVSAQADSSAAQKDLNEARKEAKEKLDDLRRQLQDIALNEDEANYRVARAADDLRKRLADPGASSLDRTQARLELRRANADRRDTFVESDRIRSEYAERSRLGIEGSPEVQRALERVARASDRVRESQEKLVEAQQNVTRTQQEGKRTVEEAEKRYLELKEKVAEASTAFDIAAAASGRTREQVLADAEIINKAKAEFRVKVDSGQLDDFNERLAATMALFLAFQMMNDPRNVGVPFDVLMRQARDQVAGLMSAFQPAVTTKSGRGAATRGDRDNYAEGGGVPDYVPAQWLGEVHGPGTSTSDSIPARLSAGEHVWTAAEVIAAGGHAAVRAIRAAVKAGALRSMPAIASAFAADYVAPARFDVRALYGGLNANVRATSLPVARFADGGAVPAATSTVVNNTTSRSGMQIGDVIINNPVRERSDRSIRRTVQTLAYLYDR